MPGAKNRLIVSENDLQHHLFSSCFGSAQKLVPFDHAGDARASVVLVGVTAQYPAMAMQMTVVLHRQSCPGEW